MNCISFKTKFGWISVFERKNKIEQIRFGKRKNKSVSKRLIKLKSNILNFFDKKDKKIVFKDPIIGTNIQKKVWRELSKIKFGKTKSYGQIAKKYKLSPRHVGKICSQNKIVLAIPCHRVVRSDGKMGGFSGIGGINLKRKLLNFENSWKQ